MCISDKLDIWKYYMLKKKGECNILHLSLFLTGQLRELKNAADQGASIPLPEGNEDDDLEDDLDIEVCSFDS